MPEVWGWFVDYWFVDRRWCELVFGSFAFAWVLLAACKCLLTSTFQCHKCVVLPKCYAFSRRIFSMHCFIVRFKEYEQVFWRMTKVNSTTANETTSSKNQTPRCNSIQRITTSLMRSLTLLLLCPVMSLLCCCCSGAPTTCWTVATDHKLFRKMLTQDVDCLQS